MCWVSTKEYKSFRAEDNYAFYKVFRVSCERGFFGNKVRLVSPFFNCKYKVGKVYSTEINLKELADRTEIYEGFHMLDSKEKTFQYIKEYFLYNYVVMQVIVPAGGTIYINDNGEVVADKIYIPLNDE